MMSKKTIVILLCIIFALILLAGLLSSNFSKGSLLSQVTTGTTSKPTESLVLSFQAVPASMEIGETTQVHIRVKPEGAPLTVATVELQYNPALVEVVQMDQGNLWNQQSQMENNIDNAKGVARITVGQGFDAQPTGDTLVASYVFKAKAAGTVPLALGSKTLFARVGYDGPLPVFAEPYAIRVQ